MGIRPETWLETVLGSPSQIRLLRVLARDPAKAWTEREAGVEAGLPPSTANVAFKRLYQTGLLEMRRAGRSHLVRLRTDFEVAQRLIELFIVEATTLDRALAAAGLAMPPRVALYLYGSTARNQAALASDIDLFVVGPDPETSDRAASAARTALRKILPAPVEVIALDRKAAKRSRYKRLIKNVTKDGRRLSKTRLEEAMK